MRFALFLVLTCVVFVAAEEKEQYDSKFDNIDLGEIFRSERLIKNYQGCFMGRGNCTPQGAAIKSSRQNPKMNFKLFVSLLSVIVICACKETYDSKFDNIDLIEIFKSERLLSNYHNCFMERLACTPQGASIKKNLPDALKTECSKCTEKQKENAKKTLNFLFDEKPELYKELEGKYDPEHVYRKKKEETGKF